MAVSAPDLTQRPPRSPRVRLGGYVILPRMLDKGRALLASRQGEYKYACPMDWRFLDFAGIDPDALKQRLAEGKSDGEILAWIHTASATKPSVAVVAAWSALQEQRAPSDPEARGFFNDVHKEIAPQRDDIATWFDLLDLDDYVSFGGRP